MVRNSKNKEGGGGCAGQAVGHWQDMEQQQSHLAGAGSG